MNELEVCPYCGEDVPSADAVMDEGEFYHADCFAEITGDDDEEDE